MKTHNGDVQLDIEITREFVEDYYREHGGDVDKGPMHCGIPCTDEAIGCLARLKMPVLEVRIGDTGSYSKWGEKIKSHEIAGALQLDTEVFEGEQLGTFNGAAYDAAGGSNALIAEDVIGSVSADAASVERDA